MPENWIGPNQDPIAPELLSAVGGHPLVARGLVNRGILEPAEAASFLDPTRYLAASPLELPGTEQAAARIAAAVGSSEPIGVWGDFDSDGLTATAVIVSTVRNLGGVVSAHIPNRQTESHGLNLPGLQALLDSGVGLVVTCDTGVRDHQAADYLKARGVDLIVTDHHDLPTELPEAVAVLNPKRLEREHPFAGLPGAGCAYLLAHQLLAQAHREQSTHALLDLVAIGIVADLAVLRGEVRYLLQLGLAQLRNTQRVGLRALLAVARVLPEAIDEQNVAFELAPRLNALGRLGDPKLALELLLTGDPSEAHRLAEQTEALNARRRLITDQVTQAAERLIERAPALLDAPALLLQHTAWPEGVLGLVAGRLAERYRRPVLLISIGEGGMARGSARSVRGIDISAALDATNRFLARYGGHPLAAGFRIEAEQIPGFRAALMAHLGDQEPEIEPVRVDAELTFNELTPDLATELQRLAPFGPGNPPFTLLARRVKLKGVRQIGAAEAGLRLTVSDGTGATRKLNWWSPGKAELPEDSFDLVYRPRFRSHAGERQLELDWVEWRPAERELPERLPREMGIQIVDLREAVEPLAALGLLGREGLQIWSEDSEAESVPLLTRDELRPAGRLAVWSVPPGPAEFQAAVRKVRPQTIYLFGNAPIQLPSQQFLERLVGLIKFAVEHRAGRMELGRAAGVLGQRRQTLEAGLQVLEALGKLSIERIEGDRVRLRFVEAEPIVSDRSAAILGDLLRETAAYRRYFLGADVESLRRSLTRMAGAAS